MSDRPAPRRLLLLFGAVIAAVNLVAWSLADLSLFGYVTTRGLRMALFALSATLALYIVLRIAQAVVGEEVL